jgi:single-stranded DNA-binding protein
VSLECAFMGTIARDAEAKISKSGKSYLRFTIRAGDGDAAQWVSVMYFGADAAELVTRMVKGTRVYTEGALRLDTWEQDGKPRSGLSVMSWHCRISEIGRNRPKRHRKPAAPPAASQRRADDFYSDPVPF